VLRSSGSGYAARDRLISTKVLEQLSLFVVVEKITVEDKKQRRQSELDRLLSSGDCG